MDVYVGMDVHHKRSQVAIIDEAGVQQRNRNVPNDPAKLGPDPGRACVGHAGGLEAAYGWAGWSICWRTWS
jgi:transposase